MIIDSHVHIAEEANQDFGDVSFTAEGLIRHMDGAWDKEDKLTRVDYSVVQPRICDTIMEHDWELAHNYLVRVVQKYPKRLIGCAVINPYHPLETTFSRIRILIKEKEFKALKLHPTIHGYHPLRARKRLLPIFEEVEALGVPLIIHTGDPPNSVPVLWAPFAKDFPKVKIIISHLGTQKICYADEAKYLAENHNNIILETGWAQLPRLKETVMAIGTKRLVFGSDAPVQEIGSQMRTVQVLGWAKPLGLGLSKEEVNGILGYNFAELIGLSD